MKFKLAKLLAVPIIAVASLGCPNAKDFANSYQESTMQQSAKANNAYHIFASPLGNDALWGEIPEHAVRSLDRVMAISEIYYSPQFVSNIHFSRGGFGTGQHYEVTRPTIMQGEGKYVTTLSGSLDARYCNLFYVSDLNVYSHFRKRIIESSGFNTRLNGVGVIGTRLNDDGQPTQSGVYARSPQALLIEDCDFGGVGIAKGIELENFSAKSNNSRITGNLFRGQCGLYVKDSMIGGTDQFNNNLFDCQTAVYVENGKLELEGNAWATGSLFPYSWEKDIWQHLDYTDWLTTDETEIENMIDKDENSTVNVANPLPFNPLIPMHDYNFDRKVDSVDVQLSINSALGLEYIVERGEYIQADASTIQATINTALGK